MILVFLLGLAIGAGFEFLWCLAVWYARHPEDFR